jgi:hypothetical protein
MPDGLKIIPQKVWLPLALPQEMWDKEITEAIPLRQD